jgi:uncharacterized protein YdeI (YjbR/CyaY-like superfamily)
MADLDAAPTIDPGSRAAWRAWLEDQHAVSDGVWVVLARGASASTGLGYEAAVLEALCFGWIDGRARPFEGERSLQWFSPRKGRSTWAGTNKARVEMLEAEGLMTDAGRAAIAAAKLSGMWTVLDGPERLEEPPELASALDAVPEARATWDACSRSVRKMALTELAMLRGEASRARKIAKFVERTASGEKPV